MIYAIVLTLLLFLTVSYDFGSHRRFSMVWYKIILIIFILIAGLRYKVGGDTQSYFEYYKVVSGINHVSFSDLVAGQFGFLWNVLSSICKFVSDDFAVLQFIQSAFVNITIFWFIKKYSKFRFTCLLIYFLFAYLNFNMEILRESFSISIFLIAYHFYEKRVWPKYYLLTTIAFLFHSGAVILFIFPFLRSMKYNLRSFFIISFFVLVFVIFLYNFPDLMKLLLFTDTIQNKFNAYSEYALNLKGKIYTLIVYLIIPMYLLRVWKSVNNGDKLFEGLQLVYFMLALCFVLFSGLGRFINYMIPFMIVVFADLLNNLYLAKRYQMIKRSLVILIFVIAFIPKYLYYTMDTSRFYKNTTSFNKYYPYASIFSKEEYNFRKIIYYGSMNESADRKVE